MKNYKIAVAGTGYVGLSLSVLLAQHNQVMAVDIVQAKVDMIVDIQCGSLKVNPLTLKMWKKLLKSRKKLQLHVIGKLVKFICIRIRQQMML